MKIKNLSNYNSSVGIEVYDVDWNCSEEIVELGKICASQCIVFVNENIPTKTLYDCMMKWGDPSRALIHEYVLTKKIHGRHWREILLNLGYINSSTEDDIKDAVSIVSYKKGPKNKPVGIFQNGELEWHSDQCSFDDGQRVIGLQSVSDTINSQTQFLCTHDAYESLSLDMQSVVKELIVRHKWFPNVMAPSLNLPQDMILHYNMVPLDGMETKLYRQTSTGLPGMKIPLHSFDGFVGMTIEESNKIMEEIKKSVFKEDYIYTQNWIDGQIVFMDQEITLHKRPTNVKDGDKRSMARVISYLNKIFNTEQSQRSSSIRYNGNFYSLDDFAKLVDEGSKKNFFYKMIYYKKLDPNNFYEVQEKISSYIIDYVNQNITEKKLFYNFISDFDLQKFKQDIPELFKIIQDSLESEVILISYIFIDTHSYVPIHTDGNDLEIKKRIRLNWPILNSTSVSTIFYKKFENVKPNFKSLPNGVCGYCYELNDCYKVDEYVLDTPTLMNVRELHGVEIIDDRFPRILLSMRLSNEEQIYQKYFLNNYDN